MYSFEKLTINEIAEMANNIALEQGENARDEFITNLIAEYHTSLAN